MSALIIDKENHSREILRSFSSHFCDRAVFEVKTPKEALRILDSEKSKIQFILFSPESRDGSPARIHNTANEAASFLQAILDRPFLDFSPLILLTLDRFQVLGFNALKQYQRADHTLVKPFTFSTLEKALPKAYSHRFMQRNQILFLGAKPLLQWVGGGWESFHWVKTASEYEKRIESFPFRYGVHIVQPASLPSEESKRAEKLIKKFKKTFTGTLTPIVCVGNQPSEVFAFRTLCQYFVSPRSEKEWKNLIYQVQLATTHRWTIDLALKKIKIFLQTNQPLQAEKSAHPILRLKVQQGAVYSRLGDIQVSLGKHEKAISFYQKALEINPCLPRPYLKIFQIMAFLGRSRLSDLSEKAVQYCPKNRDVLRAVTEYRDANSF